MPNVVICDVVTHSGTEMCIPAAPSTFFEGQRLGLKIDVKQPPPPPPDCLVQMCGIALPASSQQKKGQAEVSCGGLLWRFDTGATTLAVGEPVWLSVSVFSQ